MSTRANYVVNPKPNHVADYSRVLTSSEKSSVEAHIGEAPIKPYVVYVTDIGDPKDFAQELYREWHLDKDVVVVIATDQHQWGYTAPQVGGIDANWRKSAGALVGGQIAEDSWGNAGIAVVDSFGAVAPLTGLDALPVVMTAILIALLMGIGFATGVFKGKRPKPFRVNW